MNELSTSLPLLEASKRLKAATYRKPAYSKKHPSLVHVPSTHKLDLGEVIGMKSAGVPLSRIAQVMDVDPRTVQTALNHSPDARDRILEYREALKVLKIQRAHALEGKMWSRAEQEVDSGDAKSVDAMFRALAASEKIQVSASGEGQKVEISGTLNPVEDIKILIANIINAASS